MTEVIFPFCKMFYILTLPVRNLLKESHLSIFLFKGISRKFLYFRNYGNKLKKFSGNSQKKPLRILEELRVKNHRYFLRIFLDSINKSSEASSFLIFTFQLSLKVYNQKKKNSVLPSERVV